MKGAFSFDFNQKSLNHFEAQCEAAIRNIGRGTKKATIAACEEIISNSRAEVPKDTCTLLMSAFYEVSKRTDTAASTWAYEAIIGYGGNGDPAEEVHIDALGMAIAALELQKQTFPHRRKEND